MQNATQVFNIGLHCAYVAHVWRQFSTYRKWNCSAVLVKFSLFGRCLSGDVRCGGNLEKVGGKTFTPNAKQYFPIHWIALRFVCARLSSIFDIPEVELECSISVLAHPVRKCTRHVRRNIEKVGKIVYAKRDAPTQCFPVGLHCAYVAHVWR